MLNAAFGGKTPCPKNPQYTPRKTKTRISFNQVGTERIQHEACRSDCWEHASYRSFGSYEPGMIKILVCDTDKEGFGEFYNTYRDVAQKQQDSWVLAGPGFLPGGSKTNYNKGATVVHSMGKYLGLEWVFGNGYCATGNEYGSDRVPDTNKQMYPSWQCPTKQRKKTSCGSLDNSHNFMDMSPDSCMCSFSRGQAKRMWDFIFFKFRDLLPAIKCTCVNNGNKYACRDDYGVGRNPQWLVKFGEKNSYGYCAEDQECYNQGWAEKGDWKSLCRKIP